MEDSVRRRYKVRLPTNTERVQRARPQEGYICEDYDPVEELKKMVDNYSEEKKKKRVGYVCCCQCQRMVKLFCI